MRWFLNNFPADGPHAINNYVGMRLGRSWKSIDRQLFKIAQQYAGYNCERDGAYRPPELVEVDLGTERAGSPWTPMDFWVIGKAYSPKVREKGFKADNPEHVSRCLGRAVAEVRDKLQEIHDCYPSFGVLGFGPTVYSNLSKKRFRVNGEVLDLFASYRRIKKDMERAHGKLRGI